MPRTKLLETGSGKFASLQKLNARNVPENGKLGLAAESRVYRFDRGGLNSTQPTRCSGAFGYNRRTVFVGKSSVGGFGDAPASRP